jgi:ornithine cyclodeaminase/alanine dehydrogenase-like protein (mu-crystallin family)
VSGASAENANGSAPVRENRVAVIGRGQRGRDDRLRLATSRLVREILLLDRDESKAAGEAMDLQHAAPLGPPVLVRATNDYGEAARSAIVVITAGAANKPGGGGRPRASICSIKTWAWCATASGGCGKTAFPAFC